MLCCSRGDKESNLIASYNGYLHLVVDSSLISKVSSLLLHLFSIIFTIWRLGWKCYIVKRVVIYVFVLRIIHCVSCIYIICTSVWRVNSFYALYLYRESTKKVKRGIRAPKRKWVILNLMTVKKRREKKEKLAVRMIELPRLTAININYGLIYQKKLSAGIRFFS